MLKAGFARIDITPTLGTTLAGYFYDRPADGILDPLLATAVVFDNEEKRIAVVSVDNLGFAQPLMSRVREQIAQKIETPKEAVFVACTHTHLGPKTLDNLGHTENEEYIEWMVKKLGDVAFLAAQDLAPARLLYTRGTVQDVAFVRRYRMKDGSIKTNPGRLNPNIAGPIGEPDENSSLLIVKREGKPEIGIVNFQVHPDVIGGCKMSADYPKFVRDTYERNVPNSLCMYMNGAQGDTNHINVALPKEINGGYQWSAYMGQKIAMSVISNYRLAQELSGEAISFGQKNIFVTVNKGRPDQMEEAKAIYKVYVEEGTEAAAEFSKDKKKVAGYVEAKRIIGLMDMPDEKELYLTAVSVGDVVFAGFPGEPFTDIGRQVKANSPFTLTIPACCANGYEGYYPMSSCFTEGGYEVITARYVSGTAEKIIENSSELVKSLK